LFERAAGLAVSISLLSVAGIFTLLLTVVVVGGRSAKLLMILVPLAIVTWVVGLVGLTRLAFTVTDVDDTGCTLGFAVRDERIQWSRIESHRNLFVTWNIVNNKSSVWVLGRRRQVGRAGHAGLLLVLPNTNDSFTLYPGKAITLLDRLVARGE